MHVVWRIACTPVFTPDLIQELRRSSRHAAKAPAQLLIVVGSFEGLPKAQGGNGIPQAAEYAAGLLRTRGHAVEMVSVPDETHDSLKPALVSRACGWLERVWSDAEGKSLPQPQATPPFQPSPPTQADRVSSVSQLGAAGSAPPGAWCWWPRLSWTAVADVQRRLDTEAMRGAVGGAIGLAALLAAAVTTMRVSGRS